MQQEIKLGGRGKAKVAPYLTIKLGPLSYVQSASSSRDMETRKRRGGGYVQL